ncbi:hypothetical protein [Prochlorococcus marinus]|nr:hypothetical protein [Prochlorococcus marinus]
MESPLCCHFQRIGPACVYGSCPNHSQSLPRHRGGDALKLYNQHFDEAQ